MAAKKIKNSSKIHDSSIGLPIFHMVDPKFHKNIRTKAKKLGLDKLPNANFNLFIQEDIKYYRPIMYRCSAELVGNGEFVWLLFSNLNEWLKTSPIKSVKLAKAGVVDIKTLNSTYRLAWDN